jgi:hypothetical protein
MINALGDEIRWTDRYRHKYDSAMAEWLDSGPEPDESTGSVDWRGHVARFGKRLLHTDDRGFVSVECFDTEAEAVDRFEVIDAEYGAWLDDDEPYDDEPTTDEPEPDEPLHVTMTLEALGTGTMTGTDPTVMNRYNVTLQDQNGNVLVVPFFTGLGWTTEPTIGDVLSCLASDLTVDSPDEAEDIGLGIRAYLQLKDQNGRVQAFFGRRLDVLVQFDADDRFAAAATGTEVTL